MPPACREEVLGDFCERYRSPAQYAFDAVFTVPLVISSRIRRTSDPQIVLIQSLRNLLVVRQRGVVPRRAFAAK